MCPSPGKLILMDTKAAQSAKLIQAPAGEIPPQPTPPKPAVMTTLGRDRTGLTPPVTKRYYIPMTIVGQVPRIIVRAQLLTEAHDLGSAHASADRVYQHLQGQLYWANMQADCAEVIGQCLECHKEKT